ncbi:hypothetical protein Sjap_003194 [Stephania japonica]|uniref:Uncharacterized protein n=1 Tax=Stephania japonica TaxID=461633 RepID=A0AAP0KQP4_9MAGN
MKTPQNVLRIKCFMRIYMKNYTMEPKYILMPWELLKLCCALNNLYIKDIYFSLKDRVRYLKGK